jgi:glycerol-1-phosphate dehydrogenase [NAD(P)+]
MNTDYTKKGISELSRATIKCECGHTHSVMIEDIVVERGAVARLPEILAKYKGKKMLMVADPNTYEACGKAVEQALKGYNLTTFVYKDKHIDASLHYTGRLLVEMDPSYEFILAVGSGVINDMSRTVAYRTGVPYAIVGTAASMDGYASTISPTFIDGNKFSVPGTIAKIIVGDLDILEKAPGIMLKAGFGDVLGKIIAHADWDFAHIKTGEHICETCKKIVMNAYDKCVANIGGITMSSPDAVKAVFEALVLSGMAIGLYGDSRPASGSEHMFAHYWDIVAINDNRSHPLHGISVGVGTYVSSLLYEYMSDELPEGLFYPKPEEIKSMLGKIDAPHSPAELGLSREEFESSVIDAWKNKPDKYTILHFVRDLGRAGEMAERLCKVFY